MSIYEYNFFVYYAERYNQQKERYENALKEEIVTQEDLLKGMRHILHNIGDKQQNLFRIQQELGSLVNLQRLISRAAHRRDALHDKEPFLLGYGGDTEITLLEDDESQWKVIYEQTGDFYNYIEDEVPTYEDGVKLFHKYVREKDNPLPEVSVEEIIKKWYWYGSDPIKEKGVVCRKDYYEYFGLYAFVVSKIDNKEIVRYRIQ